MTYNFDPEKWYEREMAVLTARRKAENLAQGTYDAAANELYDRYCEMLDRLDGTYRIPSDPNG